MENKYKFEDIFYPVAVAINDAKDSPYDKFVGLEHYDTLEPIISRYTDTSLLSSSVKEFHAGDMLVARRNVYLRRAGLTLFDGLTSGDSIVLRIKDKDCLPDGLERDTLSRIMPFVLNSDNFWIYANKHADGMNSKRISIENLLNYEFTLSSLDEQKELAGKLWAAYEVKQSYLKMIDATEEMVKSQFIEMFKEDNMIPLGQFCIIEKGTTITREQVCPGNIPVVAGGKEPSCYHNNSNRDAGAITVSASGAYAGYVNYWDMPIFASDCNTIKPKQNYDVDVTFLYSGLKAMQNEIYDLQKGGAQPHVYGKDLEKVLFPLPIHEKQLNFSAIAKHADKSEFELRKSIDAIDKVIKSLINENL